MDGWRADGNNYVVVPPSDRIETVNAILYYSDVHDCASPTAVVPLKYPEEFEYGQGFEGEGRKYGRQERPEFCEREVVPLFAPGTILIYHQAVFHHPWNSGPQKLFLVPKKFSLDSNLLCTYFLDPN